MLTSEVELALLDCIEMRWRLSKQLWCELHRRLGEKALIANFQAQITSLFCSATNAKQCGRCTSAIRCTLICFSLSTYAHRCSYSYSDHNDTYTFVPEGATQSLTVHRSTGDFTINRVSCSEQVLDKS